MSKPMSVRYMWGSILIFVVISVLVGVATAVQSVGLVPEDDVGFMPPSVTIAIVAGGVGLLALTASAITFPIARKAHLSGRPLWVEVAFVFAAIGLIVGLGASAASSFAANATLFASGAGLALAGVATAVWAVRRVTWLRRERTRQ